MKREISKVALEKKKVKDDTNKNNYKLSCFVRENKFCPLCGSEKLVNLDIDEKSRIPIFCYVECEECCSVYKVQNTI